MEVFRVGLITDLLMTVLVIPELPGFSEHPDHSYHMNTAAVCCALGY